MSRSPTCHACRDGTMNFDNQGGGCATRDAEGSIKMSLEDRLLRANKKKTTRRENKKT